MSRSPAMKSAGADHCRVATADELRQKVVRLLAVDDTGEGAVLPLEEDAGEHQDVHQEAGLTLREAEARDCMDAVFADAVAHVGHSQFSHPRNSSARRGSSPRPPRRPVLARMQVNPARARLAA